MWRWLESLMGVYPSSHVHRAVELVYVQVPGGRSEWIRICPVCRAEVL